jgi:hypothetical protein
MNQIAITAAVVAVVGASSAQAEGTGPNDIVCHLVTFVGNHQNYYSFANNTSNGAGNIGTWVETGYTGDGRTVMSVPGQRPIWAFGYTGDSTLIVQRSDPSWSITMAHVDPPNGNNMRRWPATLTHRGRVVGSGECYRRWNPVGTGMTIDNAPDMGGE